MIAQLKIIPLLLSFLLRISNTMMIPPQIRDEFQHQYKNLLILPNSQFLLQQNFTLAKTQCKVSTMVNNLHVHELN